jgi:serine protease Do
MSYNLGEMTERLRRSTVKVRSGARGSGSGVIVSSTGWILTNRHVLASHEPLVELWDGRRFPAPVLAVARRHDLALINVDTLGLPAASLDASVHPRPGELVMAVGNPLGFAGAVSTGVIHAVGPVRGLGPASWVQAAIRLAPGNSGGPLAAASGNVIGLNTMAVAGGLALAIPADILAAFLQSWRDKRKAA